MIDIKTNHGDITIEIFENEAPITSENFLQYIKDGSYNGTIFHRVIPNFMIQGGGMDKHMVPISTRDPIKNEANNGLKNKRGTLAMARTKVIDSATSQFFINLNDNDFLDYGDRDYGYAVFGKVTDGMEIVDLIARVSTGNKHGHHDVPLETVEIIEVKIND